MGRSSIRCCSGKAALSGLWKSCGVRVRRAACNIPTTICASSGAAMQFAVDDFDWAFGELVHLFSVACRTYRMPHEINPALFHEAWTLLNPQPDRTSVV